jgi:hypothetical protein
MQSKNEVRKLDVPCECNAPALSAPSFADTLAIISEANKAAYGINPFSTPSACRIQPHAASAGNGYINLADGPDDFQQVRCDGGNGTGRVISDN